MDKQTFESHMQHADYTEFWFDGYLYRAFKIPLTKQVYGVYMNRSYGRADVGSLCYFQSSNAMNFAGYFHEGTLRFPSYALARALNIPQESMAPAIRTIEAKAIHIATEEPLPIITPNKDIQEEAQRLVFRESPLDVNLPEFDLQPYQDAAVISFLEQRPGWDTHIARLWLEGQTGQKNNLVFLRERLAHHAALIKLASEIKASGCLLPYIMMKNAVAKKDVVVVEYLNKKGTLSTVKMPGNAFVEITGSHVDRILCDQAILGRDTKLAQFRETLRAYPAEDGKERNSFYLFKDDIIRIYMPRAPRAKSLWER